MLYHDCHALHLVGRTIWLAVILKVNSAITNIRGIKNMLYESEIVFSVKDTTTEICGPMAQSKCTVDWSMAQI